MFPFALANLFQTGRKTATADTVIRQIVRPLRKARTLLAAFSYTAGGTDHTGRIRYPIGKTTIDAAAASATTLVLRTQPLYGTGANLRAIGSTELLIVERFAGGIPEYDLVTVTSSDSLTLTVGTTSNAFAAGANCWLMAKDADVVPGLMGVCPTFTLTASTNVNFPTASVGVLGGIAMSLGNFEPLLFESDNGTAAGALLYTIQGHAVMTSGRGGNSAG